MTYRATFPASSPALFTAHRLLFPLLSLLLFCLATVAPAAGPESLLQWVPDDSNALVIVDAKSLFDSPLAQREKWQQQYADQYAAHPLLLPPQAVQFLMAADLDFSMMVPRWEIAAMYMNQDWTADALARHFGSQVDSIEGLPVIKTTDDAYVLRVDSGNYRVYSPANRQWVSRWIRQSRGADASALPEYLARIADGVWGDAAQIRIAIRLQDVFPQFEIRQTLANSKVLHDTAINVDAAAQVLSSVEGVTLLVKVDDQIHGTLEVNFVADVSPIGEVAKPLLLEQLKNLGATLEDLDQWTASVQKDSAKLSGQLSETGLRRILSLFAVGHAHTTPPTAQVAKTTEPKPAPSTGNTPQSDISPMYSQKYFQSVSSYVAELQNSVQSASPYQFMMWLDSYADRIDQLPTVAVDPDLLTYGQGVSRQLRQMLAALNGLDQQSLRAQSQIIPNRTVTYGMLPTWRTYNYGGYRSRLYAPFAYQHVDVGGVQRQQQQIQREAVGKAESLARNILDQIVKNTETIRSRMSQRYHVQF